MGARVTPQVFFLQESKDGGKFSGLTGKIIKAAENAGLLQAGVFAAQEIWFRFR